MHSTEAHAAYPVARTKIMRELWSFTATASRMAHTKQAKKVPQ